MRLRLTIFALVSALAVQSASPCVAMCAAGRAASTATISKSPAVPACHAAKAAHDAAKPGANKTASKSRVAPLACCCMNDASANSQSEAPAVQSTVGGGAHELIAASSVPRPSAVHNEFRLHSDRSPPGQALFIAHRSLLI